MFAAAAAQGLVELPDQVDLFLVEVDGGLDPYPTHQVADVVAAADWFVLPSTHEPCSVALIEALALGVPVIASASGGNVDIVQAAHWFERGLPAA